MVIQGIQGLQFRLIPNGGGSAVGLNKSDIFRPYARTDILKAPFHTQDLAFGVGSGNGFSLAVGTGTDGIDDPEDMILVPEGVLHPFQNKNHGSFPQNKPVG